MELKQYKFEKVEIGSKTWELPTEKQYFFETGARRSIMVKPIWTTWQKETFKKDEEVFRLEIICVSTSWENKIDFHLIQVSEIESLYYSTNRDEKSDLIKAIINNDVLVRTQEQFTADYNKFFDRTNLILE